MTTSMLDQILFNLRCGHHAVLGRLANKNLWTCESCGEETDLAAGPYKAVLDRDLYKATQIDLQAKVRGEKVTRAGSQEVAEENDVARSESKHEDRSG